MSRSCLANSSPNWRGARPGSLQTVTQRGGADGFVCRAAAGFVPTASIDPSPGFHGPLYIACDFPLCPVWLPALFDDVGGLHAAVRRWKAPLPTLLPRTACDDFLDAEGPGFSGMLACPMPGAAFFETSAPKAVSEPPPVEPIMRKPASVSLWEAMLGFWRSTPAFARGIVLAVPLMAPTLFYGPKLNLQIPSAGNNSWISAIRSRATSDLRDDFHAGFGAWRGKSGWESTWSLDGSGSAQPGRLALFSESLPLTDYRFEFQGQILSKAMGFVFRAADTNNYHAAKIMILKPGPLATATLVRYAVINGREGPKTQVPLSLTARSDTIYKLLVTVEGDHFSVDVNGQFAAAWTDDRLKSGGVGFFADKGEVARLRSIHVVDKEDFLGWLCYQVSQWTADKRKIGVKE